MSTYWDLTRIALRNLDVQLNPLEFDGTQWNYDTETGTGEWASTTLEIRNNIACILRDVIIELSVTDSAFGMICRNWVFPLMYFEEIRLDETVVIPILMKSTKAGNVNIKFKLTAEIIPYTFKPKKYTFSETVHELIT